MMYGSEGAFYLRFSTDFLINRKRCKVVDSVILFKLVSDGWAIGAVQFLVLLMEADRDVHETEK